MSKLREIAESILDSFERDGEDYLIQVFDPIHGYEWYPVTEEMVELLVLLTEELQ